MWGDSQNRLVNRGGEEGMKTREWQDLALRDEDWKRMRRTKAGAFAHFIDELLYAMGDINTEESGTIQLVCPAKVHIGSHIEDWVKWKGRKEDYADARETLLELGQLLEAIALRCEDWKREKRIVHGQSVEEEKET